MSRYFIAATDYGSKANNERLPRWRVYTWARRRTAWGHLPTVPVSSYFWTEEEVRNELLCLQTRDADRRDAILACLTVLGLGAVAFGVLWIVALQ